MEAVSRIDQRAGFAFGGARGECGKQNTRAARAGVAANLGHGTARKAANASIHFRDAGRNEIENVSVAIVEGREDATAEIGLDLGAEGGKGGGRHGVRLGGAKSLVSFAYRIFCYPSMRVKSAGLKRFRGYRFHFTCVHLCRKPDSTYI
jgi:hypothetical protein